MQASADAFARALQWHVSSVSAFPGGRAQHTQAVKKAFAECKSIVQRYDREGFVWVNTLQPSTRAPVMMLRALNAEISTIGDSVSHGGDAMREIKFQWWKDAIVNCFKGMEVKHPVIEALAFCISIQPLSQYRLQHMLEAKRADQCEHRTFQTLQSLEDFAESTQSQLLYLQLQSAGIQSSDADHAASHLGKAVGLTSMLRGMHQFLKQGTHYFPVDLCTKHSVVPERLLQGEELDSAGVREIVFEMASVAHVHLKHSIELHGRAEKLPQEAKQLMLARVSCQLFLQALERNDFSLFSNGMRGGGFSPLWYALQVQWARARL
jgi:NADH dehydrogenase [ubiquinone] 1 alpha subcomplex assembly factor 6